MSDTQSDTFRVREILTRALNGPRGARAQQKAKRVWRRMRANAGELVVAFDRRKARISSASAEHPVGHRPQDLLAILVLTVGIAVIALDAPSYPWIRSLPGEYRNFFRSITDIGKAHWILWSSGLFMIATMALDWRALSFRVRMGLTIFWTYLGFIFFTVAASGIAALVLKWTLGRPRPKLFDQVGPMGFDFLAFHVHYTSFPSGHATTVAAFAAALCFIFPSWLWLIVVAAFWLAFSRIMVGAHYPSDVIAGTLLGLAFTLWTVRYLAARRIGFKLVSGEGIRPIVSGATARRCTVAIGKALWAARTASKTNTATSSTKTDSADAGSDTSKS